MKIYAHRGYSRYYPENTLIAFEKALEAGCDGIECDVQLTRDRVPVIIHDEKIDRTSDGKGYVKNYTYKELLNFDFSRIRPGSYGPCRILTLKELLEVIRLSGRNITLNLELKNSIIEYNGLEEIVLAETKEYENDFEIIYSTFNHNSIRRLIRLKKDIKAAPLVNRSLPDLVRYVKSLGASGVHPSILILSEEIIQSLLENDIYVNVYTINDMDLAKRLSDLHVTGIFTDYCKEMKEALTFGKEFSID
ncbi:glycerophosphodiester phosphodiesterase [Proteiniclasticum sp. QWL-01]|uniref:glycerophosphodiester phosphodiesterase n=1 Tax=Proteiniclasticum sp. QWL-01 TaxID=3036945 RepID=UPI00220BC70B|nr:glycerophosphodiester phosphodiesterase [Proteiniclasticum sp. QWL-01]UUM10760.1 glycerophosphodiester phosphodiesterase [Clostridiaceae bacterium HFYG-1003]WFF72103.1 glycerophosphodiester phosphodiesterase [Proteiniclasticum sp. QWL-01]